MPWNFSPNVNLSPTAPTSVQLLHRLSEAEPDAGQRPESELMLAGRIPYLQITELIMAQKPFIFYY